MKTQQWDHLESLGLIVFGHKESIGLCLIFAGIFEQERVYICELCPNMRVDFFFKVYLYLDR